MANLHIPMANPIEEGLPPALKVDGLGFHYGSKKVLEGVTMAIPTGKVTAMIGPSGCGKSTLLKALNRIAELEGRVQVTGKIEFFGQDIYDQRVNINSLRREIGMVFQRPNPFPTSVYENIVYGVKLCGRASRGELDEIVERSLTRAVLWDEVKDSLKKSALGLSGGQQQRLCIARALAVNPKVLLMDEPCSALDPISTLKIEELIKSLRENVTITIVTHNMQQALRVSDYTAFFNTDESRIGQLVEFDTTQNIFSSPQEVQTRDYVAGRFG
ncbi:MULTISPECIES: phosphate ABC transporter ATP-binding protein PstB [unclassified Synechocystis]|uniref:phosphate ABC transporter ATP-binding protein PstB n=1 Tax=unclassified Synechocystis TaxID=2640012 RepID=UPI0003FC1772|nr:MULTISPECIES: phosphate ABC transporter ATP-binding protein PstB [unclassified Synechocystis]AIE72676.1 Phosphate transport ATP-binding protein PstB [Synechocystis sp. PCC 6714]